jgi:hypothetical protein
MTAGYDEWAVARTPSLLAFASALVEDAQAADAAVAGALARTRSSWHRVSQDDPDLEARRHVVRACSTPRRAAVVLRVLEQRSDAEIAEVLRCSESAARRHLQRGFAEIAPAEAGDSLPAVRDHLVARAGSAPSQLLTRQPTTGTPPTSPRRHRGPWLAGIAVVLLVGGVAFVAHETRTPDGVISYPKVAVPQSWRYESYDGVELQVPDTWGWGAAPIRSSYFAGRRHLGSCGANQAAVLSRADHSSYTSSLTQFVGRPALLSDRCTAWGSDGTMPEGDAVWFDSPLQVGVREVGGVLAETRAVGGQHISAFGSSSSLRRQILGSAEQVGTDANGCPTRVVSLASAGPQGLEPESLSVCVYSQDTGVAVLMYSATVSGSRAAEYAAQVASATTSGAACPTPQGQWVALGLRGGGGTRWDVVDLACDRIQLAGGRSVAIAADTVREWAVGGVTAYVVAPSGVGHALDDFFRAPAS